MDDNANKGLCTALLFVDTLLFGWPPYFLVRGSNHSTSRIRIRNLIISYLTCFAGGVFLGACLLHLLAEGRETMLEYLKMVGKSDITFPIYEAVVACGFFAIAFVEQLAHKVLKNTHHGRRRAESSVVENLRQGSESFSVKRFDDAPPGQQTIGFDNINFNNTEQKNSQENQSLEISPETQERQSNGFIQTVPEKTSNGSLHKTDSFSITTSRRGSGVVSYLPGGSADRLSISRSVTDIQETNLGVIDAERQSCHDHDAELVQILQVMQVNPIRAFLLLGALSFHTIFDGLAVGLQEDTSDIWQMFTAICIHKSLVAICLGLQLFLAFRSKPLWGFIWVFVFSLISPVGVGIGMIITSGNINSEAEDLASWVLQGLATGTFLYVTIFEILREELSEHGSILKIIVAIIGFGGMALAKYFDQD